MCESLSARFMEMTRESGRKEKGDWWVCGPLCFCMCLCLCLGLCVFSLDVEEQRQSDVLRVSRLPLGGVMANA